MVDYAGSCSKRGSKRPLAWKFKQNGVKQNGVKQEKQAYLAFHFAVCYNVREKKTKRWRRTP